MFRLFSLAAAERGRQKQRLELSLAGICELELLKRRHEALIISALALHTPEPGPESPARPHDDSNPRCPPEPSWSLMKLLQHQVGELKVDESLSDPADARPGSGSCEQTEGPCPDFSRPVRLSERPESVGDVFAGRELLRSPAPRCVSAGPCPLLEGLGVDEPWVWPAGAAEEEPEGHGRPQSVETYILGLIQRRSPLRSGKPRTSRGPEPRAVARQSSRREPEGEHQWPPRGPRPALAGIRDLPSGSEAESPQHTHSPSADELVNAQYIPAQPKHKAPKAGRSPERRPRAAPKKCRFTEEKAPPKKPSRRASRAQSENNLRGAAERRCGTAERSGTPRARRGPGHRRWRSTLELSQDEAEAEQPIRRSRQSKPRPPPAHPPGESESSLSEAESPASSSLSSDSDGSGGLVWPQQLAPPPPPGHAQQPKAFVKIKASHALKKKILRFRSGSLKVMTTRFLRSSEDGIMGCGCERLMFWWSSLE